MGVCDCEADAGSRNIQDSAPPKQGTPYSNPGIIVVPATGRSTAITAFARGSTSWAAAVQH